MLDRTPGFRFLGSVLLFLAALGLGLAKGVLAPTAQAEGPTDQALNVTLDDELLLVRDNKLLIYDPYPLNGFTVNWSMTDTLTWRDAATGDFNGDGDDEIVVINFDGTSPFTRVIRAYDPVIGPQPEFNLNIAEMVAREYRWWRVATGDVNKDGKDEIIVVTNPRTSDYLSDFFVLNQAGGPVCKGTVSGGYINGLAVVDTRNDDYPEIVMTTSRSEGQPDNVWVHWRNGLTCASLASKKLEGYAFDIAGGDLDGNNGREEVVLAHSPRNWEHDDCNSLSIWKDWGGEPLTTSGWWSYNWPGWGWGYYVTLDNNQYSPPYWNFIVVGDLNGSGDKEVATIRNTYAWDEEEPNHMKILDPYRPAGFTDINKTYETARFEGIAAGDFAGIGRDYIALLWPGGSNQLGSTPGVYLYDLRNKPKGGLGVADDGTTVTPQKTYRITAWNNERAKIMVVGDFDGGQLTSSTQAVAFTFFQDGTPFVNQHKVSLAYPGVSSTPLYTATEQPPVDWLTITPESGTLPATLTFDGSLTGITALYDLGTYTTTVVITATGSTGTLLRGSPIRLNVGLNVVDHLESQYLPFVAKN